MDFLGRIRKLDSSLQRGLDNSFARVFGGKVVPNELEECLKQEIEDFLMQDANGQYLAPNDFRIGISAADYKNLSASEPNLPNQLTDRMTRYCRNNGWGFTGTISVHLQAVESLHTGQLKTASTFTEDTVGTSEFVPFEDSADDANTDAAPSQSDDEPQAAETSAAYHPQPEAEQFPTASRPIPAVDPEAATELSNPAVDEDQSQERPSPCCCKTAPRAYSRCAMVRTSSAAAPLPTSASRTLVFPASMPKSRGMARMRCSSICIRPTAPLSMANPLITGCWPTATRSRLDILFSKFRFAS